MKMVEGTNNLTQSNIVGQSVPYGRNHDSDSRATRNLYSIGKIYIASALIYCMVLYACFSG